MINLAQRINELISLCDKTLGTRTVSSGLTMSTVNGELFNEMRTSSLSFIRNIYGEAHPYFKDFNDRVTQQYPSQSEYARGILKAVKGEIDGGWIFTMRGIISAEIFSDFIEMSEHLIKDGYKDAAAVMIGSVLEEHLRQLCTKNGILTNDPNSGKPKKANLLNSELANASVYNKLDEKAITNWLDLRNKAAHGKYAEYNQQQVELQIQSVTEFISRNSI